MGHFRRKFREEGVNRRQLRLVRWLGEDWGYHTEEKRPDVVTSSGLSTVQCTSVTDGQTDMPLAKYTVEKNSVNVRKSSGSRLAGTCSVKQRNITCPHLLNCPWINGTFTTVACAVPWFYRTCSGKSAAGTFP